ncbi:unnamed protein product [Clonostachys rosea]|uniref:C2H2-type domain-containing protein n=1 Tax=Bionectria ochroleuca TaxID=29856 RepID=A0ABY6UNK7_BIOOC|nr:unnamed protein product [Clonostachys rosea]
MSYNKASNASTRQVQGPQRPIAPISNLRAPIPLPNGRFPYRAMQTHHAAKPTGVTKNLNHHCSRPRYIPPGRGYFWDEMVEESLRNGGSDSDRDSDSSNSGSGSESDTEDEEANYAHLDHNIRLDYQSVRTDLLQEAVPQIKEHTKRTRYVSPPDDRLPPQHRYKQANAQARGQMFYEQIQDPLDPSTILVRKADGYFHLACPFYISNPTKHRKCLIEHDLQSIEDVIRHVNRFHQEPPYCPRCRETFGRATDRDRHFLSQVCEIRNWVTVEGVNSYQRTKLWKRDKIILGERKRWIRIWQIAFPDAEVPTRSHYLDGEDEVKMSIARDFWACNGSKILSKFLTQNGYDRPLSDQTLSAICGWALDDILLQLAGVSEVTTATV